ncbi:MAG: RNA polymerase sigma factor [Planctomycetota bacterium]
MPESVSPFAAALGDQNDHRYKNCAQRGIRFAAGILKNRSDAEEVVQEAFVRLQQHQPIDDEVEFTGKFFRTLKNLCIDLIRRGKIKKEIANEGDWVDGERSVLNRLESIETVALIQAEMTQLPENWRIALHMRVHQKASYHQIAEAMKSNCDQVRTWIYRGRRQLEDRLKKQRLI